MNEEEMLDQLYDLIEDRRSFLDNEEELDSIIERDEEDDPDSPFRRDIEALEKIIKDYKSLRNIVYKSVEEKGENLCIWINENVQFRKVEILNIWENDYTDIRCNAILYKEKKQVANIIVSYDTDAIKSIVDVMHPKTKFEWKFIKAPFKILIYDSFEQHLKLPKISKCSKLLQEIYDTVCESDASMCHITEDDWTENYLSRFNDKDLTKLIQEVKKYKLEDVITFNDGEYKILGYRDLETKFNDDRKLIRERSCLEK